MSPTRRLPGVVFFLHAVADVAIATAAGLIAVCVLWPLSTATSAVTVAIAFIDGRSW